MNRVATKALQVNERICNMQQVLQWLVFLYQVPARPSSLRVRAWRRLQSVGAVQIRQSAYVLPNREEAREDFEWIKTELEGAGATVTLLAASALDAATDGEVVSAFRQARAADVADLRKRVDRWLRQTARHGAGGKLPPAPTRTGKLLLEAARSVKSITFFETPGTSELEQAMSQVSERLTARSGREGPQGAQSSIDRSAFAGRRWVTRPRPGVDRMSSAWLIRRFIDPMATFEFSETVSSDAVPFDMYGADFGHQGEACSFEVLVDRFGVDDVAVRWIGRMVHDIDLRVSLYNEPETPGLAAMIEGLRRAHPSDPELLEQGIALFEVMAQGFSARQSGKETGAHGVRQKDVSRDARRRGRGRRGSA